MKGVWDLEGVIGPKPGGPEEHRFSHRNSRRALKTLPITLGAVRRPWCRMRQPGIPT